MRVRGLFLASAWLPLAACAGDTEIERPAPLYGDVPVDYPLELWDQGIEGETLLNVRVNERGEVDSAVVLRSSGHAAFDSAALAGVADMRFSPARKKGRRIVVWARIPVRFTKKHAP
ncbi:MAG: energy transducer TonB [Gemmatimonadetes bacterium]|nr:energy transducer TonB [Gemmatimonadota bacterium]